MKLFNVNDIDETKTNKVTNSFLDTFYDLKENKKEIKKALIAAPFISIFLSSFIMQTINKLTGRQEKIEFGKFFTAWAQSGFSWLLTIAFFILWLVCVYNFIKRTKKDFYADREGNFLISKKGTLGKAHWQTEDEREKCFVRDKNIENILGDIIGMDEKNRLYTLRPDLVGINRNKCIFGTPGSGKSASIIENDIIQCLRRGESAIITDSKGDLYRKLAKICRDTGHVVRVLNLKNTELKNSDAFHLLKYLEDGDPSVAEVLANCIIENSGDGEHMDYWALNELNGYKALLLYISTNEALKKAKRNTLAEMYNMCTQNTPKTLAIKFNTLPSTHPARQAFNIYANCEERVQGQILNGMGIKLSFLINQNAQQIVSHDEIDLVLPMKRPCIYFVIIPDTNKAYNIIGNLFFNMMLIKQCEYSDSLPAEKKAKQIFVNYILDEFKATGAINNFDQTITTVRSRKIGITIVLQTLGQLQDMYPGMAYDTILGSMTTKILLRAGDETTSKYFTMICGKQTRLVKASRYSDNLTDVVHTHNNETITEELQGVDLLPVDEAQKLDPDILVICILGFEPVKLRKFLSDYNPYLQEYTEKIPARHKPKWRKIIEEAEKKKTSSAEEAYSEPLSEPEQEEKSIQKEAIQKPVISEDQEELEPFDPETGEILPRKKSGFTKQGETVNTKITEESNSEPTIEKEPPSGQDEKPEGEPKLKQRPRKGFRIVE